MNWFWFFFLIVFALFILRMVRLAWEHRNDFDFDINLWVIVSMLFFIAVTFAILFSNRVPPEEPILERGLYMFWLLCGFDLILFVLVCLGLTRGKQKHRWSLHVSVLPGFIILSIILSILGYTQFVV